MLLLPWSKDVSPHAFSLPAPARSGRADPPSPRQPRALATASIRVLAVRDGELCPHGGEGHIPALLPLWVTKSLS
jgi:hypothetical protein